MPRSLKSYKIQKEAAKGGGATLVSDTQPEKAEEGTLWYKKDTEVSYIAVKNTVSGTIDWKETSSGSSGSGGSGGGGTSLTVSETAPAGASVGELWFDSQNANLYTYYDNNWIQTNRVPTRAGASIAVSSDPPVSPTNGQVWWDTTNANLYVAYDDGTGTQWIQSSSSPVSNSFTITTVSDTEPSAPVNGDFWYDTVNNALKIYDGTEWQLAGSGGGSSATPAPTISSVSPNNYDGDTGTEFIITGTNYDLGMTVDFITAVGTEVSASVVTVLNQAQISVTTPQAFLSSDGPLDVKVNRPDGQTVTLTDAIQTGGSPIWSTAGGTLYENAWEEDVATGDNSYRLEMSVNETIAATDPDGQPVTYSLESGTLPTNTSLDTDTGVISGTLPSSLPGDQTFTFTAGASDTAGNLVTRNFNIIVKNQVSGLFSFSSHTFTNCGSYGTRGPSLSQVRTAYSGVDWAQSTLYMDVTSNGIQKWKIPTDGNYKFTAYGAMGCDLYGVSHTSDPGYGYKLDATFTLTKDTTIWILVGQSFSAEHSGNQGAGGGGGTFVWVDGQSLPLIVAAGGNGRSWENHTVRDPSGRGTGLTVSGGSAGRGDTGASWNADGSGSFPAVKIYNGGTNAGYGGQDSQFANFQNLTSYDSGINTGGGGGTLPGGFGGGGATNPYEGGGGGGYLGGKTKPTNDYNNAATTYGAVSYVGSGAIASNNIGTHTGTQGSVLVELL